MKRVFLLLLLLLPLLSYADTRYPNYDHTGISASDVLQWSGSTWAHQPPSTIGNSISFGDLSDMNASGWTTGDVPYWTGSTWDDGDLGVLAGTYIDLGDLANVSGTDNPAPGTGCQGSCTWSPGSFNGFAVNIGGWCISQYAWVSSAAPSANTAYLTATNPWAFTDASPNVNHMCGSAYIYNSTDAISDFGPVFVLDNQATIAIQKSDFTNFLSTKNYLVRLICTARCDAP